MFTDGVTVLEALKRVHRHPDRTLHHVDPLLRNSVGNLVATGGESHASRLLDSTVAGQHDDELTQRRPSSGDGGVLTVTATTVADSGGGGDSEIVFDRVEYDFERRISTVSTMSDLEAIATRDASTRHRESSASTQDPFACTTRARLSQRKCKLTTTMISILN